LCGPNEFIAAHVLSGVTQDIGSTFNSVPLGGGLACESVTRLPGKCSRTIVARDSSGEVLRVYYVRYMRWFRMTMMHTKLIRMK
jgi:hypothetical protein